MSLKKIKPKKDRKVVQSIKMLRNLYAYNAFDRVFQYDENGFVNKMIIKKDKKYFNINEGRHGFIIENIKYFLSGYFDDWTEFLDDYDIEFDEIARVKRIAREVKKGIKIWKSNKDF